MASVHKYALKPLRLNVSSLKLLFIQQMYVRAFGFDYKICCKDPLGQPHGH